MSLSRSTLTGFENRWGSRQASFALRIREFRPDCSDSADATSPWDLHQRTFPPPRRHMFELDGRLSAVVALRRQESFPWAPKLGAFTRNTTRTSSGASTGSATRSFARRYRYAEENPSSIEEALEIADADGTASILDINLISSEPDFCCAGAIHARRTRRVFRRRAADARRRRTGRGLLGRHRAPARLVTLSCTRAASQLRSTSPGTRSTDDSGPGRLATSPGRTGG